MASKEPGYVYIFTNESFREGWVKIGKTQNIKKRLNQLDNTSCPLPFDVYATLKTRRYDEAEHFVHEFISHFNQSLRIRPNREYFKVAPEEALDILYNVKNLMNEPDSEIIVYDEKGKKCIKQLEKKHGKADNPQSEETIETPDNTPSVPTSKNKTQAEGYKDPRLNIPKTLPRYVACLKRKLIQEQMMRLDMGSDISAITDINKLERLREDVKVVEKTKGSHNNYACAISRYIDYIKAGYSFQDMENDAIQGKVVKTKKPSTQKQKAKAKRLPPFKFSMAGLKPDDTVVFAPRQMEVKIISDNKVEYDNNIYSLSGFCKAFMPNEDSENKEYQGPAHFTYGGKTLHKIRLEREKK